MTRVLRTYPSLEEVSRAAETMVADVLTRSDERGARIALSGGSTPLRLFELLGARTDLCWDRVHLFWSDERFVPFDHPDSNYAAARERLILPLSIPAANVHQIPTDRADPALAAAAYESELCTRLGEAGGMDLALLGIGEDGHTASLFPGVHEPEARWAMAVKGPPGRPPRDRITLTSTFLNRSRRVVFLVCGAGKRPALTRVLAGDAALPAASIRGTDETIFLADGRASPAVR